MPSKTLTRANAASSLLFASLCGLLLSSSGCRVYSDPILLWKTGSSWRLRTGVGAIALGRPSIRAGARWRRSPHPVFARRRLRSLEAKAPSNGRFAARTRRHNGHSAPALAIPFPSKLIPSACLPFSSPLVYRTRSAGLRRAPSGMAPVSRKRQSAIKSFRARATIPIRRRRLLP
jgi:hypothetical protein